MSQRLLVAFTVWMAALVAIYYTFPDWKIATWSAVGLSNTAGVLTGVLRNRPRRRLPWLLLAGGMLCFAAGTVTALVLSQWLHETPFPSLADVLFLAGCFPLLLAGLVTLTRSGAAVRDRATMIDALILTTGAGFLSWEFLISPSLHNPALTPLEKTISIGYPLCDLLILALLVRFLGTVERTWSAGMLLLAGSGLLVADVLYGLLQLAGTWQLGGPVDAGWMVFYAAGALATLHPSMAALTAPRLVRQREVTAKRTVLGMASLIAPTVLLLHALRGPVQDGVVIAVASALLIILTIARMSAVASGLRRILARERELRRACEALLSASTAAEVSSVVYAAVGRLLPRGTPHRVVLATTSEEGDAGPAVSMGYIRNLPAEVVDRFDGFELALRCRLSVGEQRVGDLFVAGGETALVALQQALPVLAGQAATMLEHITLNEEINRRDSEAYFRTLVQHAADVILIVDDTNRIRYASPSAQAVFGTDGLVGLAVLDVVEPSRHAATLAALDRVRAGHGMTIAAEWTARRPDGELVEVEASIRDLRAERTVKGLAVTVRDVTERRRLERELRRRAYLDPLTGLGNRLLFQDKVAQAANEAAATGVVAGVLLINIDDFKMTNDTMGHDVGDALLAAVGQRLSATVFGDATLARLGADEFGAVVPAVADVDELERLAEAVVAAFVAPFLVSGSVVSTQVSVGVASTADTDDGLPPRPSGPAAPGTELLRHADVALGTAKSSGKGRWRRYETTLHNQMLDRMKLRTELDRAIAEHQFELHYQPIVDLESGRTMGLEALVRWRHPERGMVQPLQFIPLAEESGLIVPLGAWVLSDALATAGQWYRELGQDAPYVSVNVSVRQFRAPDFVERVLGELAAVGLPAQSLVLEITESLLLGEPEQIQADLAVLRAAGIRVAIDDFGTGYSSLSYLHRVPVDTLKLDKSFVDTISTSARQYDLITGIIQLAATLRLEVVAEGIETQTDRRLLMEAGCHFGQGYLFARPMPYDDALERIRSERLAVSATPGDAAASAAPLDPRDAAASAAPLDPRDAAASPAPLDPRDAAASPAPLDPRDAAAAPAPLDPRDAAAAPAPLDPRDAAVS